MTMHIDALLLKQLFIQHFGEGDQIRFFFAPGRVNLIGEHIDYNGGFVFPAALTLGITALVRVNNSGKIRLKSLNHPSEVLVDLSTPVLAMKGDWGNYPKGVFFYLIQEGYVLPGCDILYYSDLPEGAGLSSSACIEVLTAYMMLLLIGIEKIDRVWIATFAQMVENKFIHMNCGIMDQFAVSMGKENAAILLDCNSLTYSYIPLDLKGYSLIIMNTNKNRELIESKYNERRSECEEVLSIINEHHSYNALCEINDESVIKDVSNDTLRKRARHVISENQRVIKSVEALKNLDLLSFAAMLTESHNSLRYDYEVTGFELDTLVTAALNATGCIGARMTGAGFGGCAIALVKTEVITDFKRQVSETYFRQTRLEASFYDTKIGNGVGEIKTIAF